MFRPEDYLANIRRIQESNATGCTSLLIIGRGNRQGLRNAPQNTHISYMTPDFYNFEWPPERLGTAPTIPEGAIGSALHTRQYDYSQLPSQTSIFWCTMNTFYEHFRTIAQRSAQNKFPLFDTIVIDGGTLHHLVEQINYNSLVALLNTFIFFAKRDRLFLVYPSPPWDLEIAARIQAIGQPVVAPIHWYLDKLLAGKGWWDSRRPKLALPHFGPIAPNIFDNSGNQSEEGSGALAFETPDCVTVNIPTKNEILTPTRFEEIHVTSLIRMTIPMN